MSVGSDIDIRLIGTLAVRDGLMEDTQMIESLPETRNQEIVSREIYKSLRDNVQYAVRRQFTIEETDPVMARNPVTKSKFYTIVDYQISNLALEIPEPARPILAERLFSDILGFGPLEKYFNDPEVTEITVNGTAIRVEKNGKETLVPEMFETIDQGVDLVRRMITKTGNRIDYAQPEVDARLHDGSRLKAHISPLACDGLLISIRRFRQDITIEKLIETNSVSQEVLDWLEVAVHQRLNIFVIGGTSTGKTTWLNTMAGYVDPTLSIITIEDPAELQLQHPNVRRLEARRPNMEGKGEYTLSDGVKDALRMAPKIIILGETRGGEAFDILQAMGTGHEGSLATAHANDAEQFLNTRFPNMVRMNKEAAGLSSDAIYNMMMDTLDIIVFVENDHGHRRLNHIAEITGAIKSVDGNTIGIASQRLWEYDPRRRTWLWVGHNFSRKVAFEEEGWVCPN